MERYVTFRELKQEVCYSELIECYRQTWKERKEWTGYDEVPRFADGLMLVCSEVVVTCTVWDGSVLEGKKGDLIYVPKGTRYTVSFRNGGRETDLYTVNFCLKDRMGNELRLGREPQILRGIAVSSCRYLASELADTYLRPEENRIKQQARFFTLLDAIAEQIENHNESYGAIRMGAERLEEEWNQNRKMEYYAESCGLSESSFYQYFKAWAGVSPNEYRQNLRIAVAKSMLQNSNLPIYEIASYVGFEDPYYFSRVFKKTVGVSPRAYRGKEA